MSSLLFLTASSLLTIAAFGWNKGLPPTEDLGPPRGYKIARTAIHLHSPISHDACDGEGTTNGKINQNCRDDLRSAICENNYDFVMLTDHPAHLRDHSTEDLLLVEPTRDQVIYKNNRTVANKIPCGKKSTLVSAGFESKLMPLAMEGRPTESDFAGMDLKTANSIRKNTSALVTVPHTEAWEINDLTALQPDGVEIYNLHANVDPKIRKDILGWDGLSAVLDFVRYTLMPPNGVEPDLIFLNFFQWSELYRNRWNALVSSNVATYGFAGVDAHQNVSKKKFNDSERVDSYRRTLRWFSNHLLVKHRNFSEMKVAISAAKGWTVFEVLGSPVGMDFYGKTENQLIEMGMTGIFKLGKSALIVSTPTLQGQWPKNPVIEVRIQKIQGEREKTVFQSRQKGQHSFQVNSPGVYRTEIWIGTQHIDGIADPKVDRNTLFPWIITNHLRFK